MILRNWKGIAKKEYEEKYINHLLYNTFPKLSKINGFIDAKIFRRPTGKGIEFLILTSWETIDAIKNFAGERINTAVVPKEVQEMMVDYDKDVIHYELVKNYSAEKNINTY
ncbi:MAG: hypothetical protein ACM34N_05220 [Ignavibacteria bacterium]